MLTRLIVLSLLIAAPALAQAPAAPVVPVAGDTMEKFSYSCVGNQTLQVVFVNTAGGSSFAVVLEEDEMIPMNLVPSASGAVYEPASTDYRYRLDTKGDTAHLYTTDGGKDTPVKTECKV